MQLLAPLWVERRLGNSTRELLFLKKFVKSSSPSRQLMKALLKEALLRLLLGQAECSFVGGACLCVLTEAAA